MVKIYVRIRALTGFLPNIVKNRRTGHLKLEKRTKKGQKVQKRVFWPSRSKWNMFLTTSHQFFLVNYWCILTLKCFIFSANPRHCPRLSVKIVPCQLGHTLACDTWHSDRDLALEVLKNFSLFLRCSSLNIFRGNHINLDKSISKWCPSTTFKRWKPAL